MKILYVEHDDDNLYMLKTRLERCGDFEVLATEDSEQGCKLAVTEHPDVILMDLEMPVMDRWEPVRTLKKDPRTRHIPIIGMSVMRRPASVRRPWPRAAMSSMPNRSNLRDYSRPFGTCLQRPNRCSADEANRGDFAALHQSANGTKPRKPRR